VILGSALVGILSLSLAPLSAVTAIRYRKKAPRFNLKDAQGSSVRLADYRGRVVLLNFWATWCIPCKTEIPWLIELQNTYRDRGFAVLGVSLDADGWQLVRPYVDEAKINYRVVIGNDRLMDRYSEFDALPSTFLIDRDSRIATTHIGLASKEVYENEILYLLAERKAGGSVPPID
jgi:peroxiredoxin